MNGNGEQKFQCALADKIETLLSFLHYPSPHTRQPNETGEFIERSTEKKK